MTKEKPPKELDAIADVVLAYRPKPFELTRAHDNAVIDIQIVRSLLCSRIARIHRSPLGSNLHATHRNEHHFPKAGAASNHMKRGGSPMGARNHLKVHLTRFSA